MKNVLILGVVIVGLFGVSIWWSKSLQSDDPNVVATNGLHSHPILEIYVKGERLSIPADIGIGGQFSSLPMGMSPVHTHDDANEGVIHLEFNGVVRKSDITLGEFLKVWGKDINSFGTNVRMKVDGVENMELDKYVMRDGDRIEIRYE
ncbi:MAG: hypothetical protein ACYCY6_00085 [Minisyncoccota bacterium]